MFHLFEKKKVQNSIVAPINGHTISLENVPDEVFAKKMLGEGVAIETTGDIVLSPADGKISFIMNTGHAFGMTLKNGMEVLVHIGLDTVKLKGEGFEILVVPEMEITAGTPIIKVNRKYIEEKGYSLITIVIVCNYKDYQITKYKIDEEVSAGKTDIILYQ